jgi:hypothetical protein
VYGLRGGCAGLGDRMRGIEYLARIAAGTKARAAGWRSAGGPAHGWPGAGAAATARLAKSSLRQTPPTAQPSGCALWSALWLCLDRAGGLVRVQYHKAPHKDAWYYVCGTCSSSEEVWICPPACPSAAAGRSDCLCGCEPLQAHQARKGQRSRFSSIKQRKINKSQKQRRGSIG